MAELTHTLTQIPKTNFLFDKNKQDLSRWMSLQTQSDKGTEDRGQFYKCTHKTCPGSLHHGGAKVGIFLPSLSLVFLLSTRVTSYP